MAAAAAWLSIVAAVLLPVPERWFQRLRWVGAASIAVVGLTLVGVPLPPAAPAVVLAVGALAVFALPQGRPRAAPEPDSD